METAVDNLTKDILLYNEQPGLQIGAWERGWGLKHGKVDDIVVYNRELTPLEVRIIANGNPGGYRCIEKPDAYTTDLLDDLKSYYISAVNPDVNAARGELRSIRTTQADSTEKVQEVMVMHEMPRPRKSHVLQRGSYDAPGEEVFPNTPESVLPFPVRSSEKQVGTGTMAHTRRSSADCTCRCQSLLAEFFWGRTGENDGRFWQPG